MSVTTTLSPVEVTWIEGMLNILPTVEAGIAQDDLKGKILKAARDTIEGSVGEIRVSESFEATLNSGGVMGFIKEKLTITETMPSISDSGDANEEFDTGHDLSKMDPMAAKDFNRLMQAQSVIAGEVAKLRRERYPDTGKPMFTDREIAEAIWAPLMRRKIIPENAIPDRYSEVASTFSGASSEYETRLAAYTESLGKFDKLAEKLGLGKDVINAAGTVGVSAVSALVSAGTGLNGIEATSMIKTAQLTLAGGLNTAATILKKPTMKDILTPDTLVSISKDVLSALAGMGESAGAGVGGSGADASTDQAIGKAVKYGISAALGGVTFGIYMAAGKPEEAIAALGDAAANALAAEDYSLKASGNADTMPDNATDIGAQIKMIVKDGVAAKKFIDAYREGKATPAELAKLLGAVVQNLVEATSTWEYDQSKPAEEAPGDDLSKVQSHIEGMDKFVEITEQQLNYATGSGSSAELSVGGLHVNEEQFVKDELELQQQDQNKAAVGAQWDAISKVVGVKGASSGKPLDKLFAEDKAMKGTAAVVKKVRAQEDAAAKQASEIAAKEFDKELVEEQRAFRQMLEQAESGDGDKEIETVENLIMLIKRDQMIVDLCFQIANVGTQAVAALLPQAGAAIAAVELVKNITRACQHFRDLLEWRQNTGDARAAMSVQMEAMLNRANLSKEQTINDTVKACEAAAKMVAGAFSTAGPFAPAGHIAYAGMTAVAAIHDVLYKFYTIGKLKAEWATYKKALENPDDRKLVRKSIRTNPTLAKYVVAYGAREGNPVARNAVKRLGLTEKVLDSKDTNVQKVEAYLEALYPDDPVLLEPRNAPKDWYPGPVTFTAASFMAFAGQAETALKPPVKSGSCARLAQLMQKREALHKAVEKARADNKAADTAEGQLADDDVSPAAEKIRADALAALHALQNVLDEAEQTASLLAGGLKSFRPVGADGAAHKEMAAYVKQLVGPAVAFLAAYRREAECLAVAEGALARDLEYGLRVIEESKAA